MSKATEFKKAVIPNFECDRFKAFVDMEGNMRVAADPLQDGFILEEHHALKLAEWIQENFGDE